MTKVTHKIKIIIIKKDLIVIIISVSTFLCISTLISYKTIRYVNDKLVNIKLKKGDLVLNKHVKLLVIFNLGIY